MTEKKKNVKLDNNVCQMRLKSANIAPDKHTSEYFLHHASSLLLLLVFNEESTQAESLICEIVGSDQVRGGVQLHLAKQRIGLTLALTLVEQGRSASTVLGLVSKMIGEATSAFQEVRYRESENIGARRRLVDLVAGWNVGVEEIINATINLKSGEEELLGDWISSFLEISCEQETASVCKVIGILITR